MQSLSPSGNQLMLEFHTKFLTITKSLIYRIPSYSYQTSQASFKTLGQMLEFFKGWFEAYQHHGG